MEDRGYEVVEVEDGTWGVRLFKGGGRDGGCGARGLPVYSRVTILG